MNATTVTPISRRDRAVLTAVADGRAVVRAGVLMIDGRFSADQFALARLTGAGLLASAASGAAAPALTPAGDDVLHAA